MPTGLYVHVPFCETKCGYCDFYSVPLHDHPTTPLTRALTDELSLRQGSVAGAFETIFAGGGTPTLLPTADLTLLFSRLGEVARRDGVCEFTTEANPATVDAAKIELLVSCGVNRVSFGGQSFHQAELDLLERLHSPQDIAPGVAFARAGGIAQVNLDLIFGIPSQTEQSWRESLRRAVDLGLDHVACYGLTYEPQTPLHARMQRGQLTPCDPDLEADLYLLAVEFLQDNGFVQYEISNFAKPGCECRHNLIYWNNQPYLGIGPSATSYLDGARFKNVSHIGSYIDHVTHRRQAWREQERLEGRQLAGEIAMLQLRLNRGIDVDDFTRRVGLSPMDVFAEPLNRHRQAGLIAWTTSHIRLTDRGRPLADAVIRDLLVS